MTQGISGGDCGILCGDLNFFDETGMGSAHKIHGIESALGRQRLCYGGISWKLLDEVGSLRLDTLLRIYSVFIYIFVD